MRSKIFINSVKRWGVSLALPLAFASSAHAQEPLGPNETFAAQANGQLLPKSPIGTQNEGTIDRKETTVDASLQLRLSERFILDAEGSFGRSTDTFFTFERHTGKLDRTIFSGRAGMAYQARFKGNLVLELAIDGGGLYEQFAPSFDGVAFDNAGASMPYASARATLGIPNSLFVSAGASTDVRLPTFLEIRINQKDISWVPHELAFKLTHADRITGHEITDATGAVPLPLATVSEDTVRAHVLWRIADNVDGGLAAQARFFGASGIFGGPNLEDDASNGAYGMYGPLARIGLGKGFEIDAGLPTRFEDGKMEVRFFAGLTYEGESLRARMEGTVPDATYSQPYRVGFGYTHAASTTQPDSQKTQAPQKIELTDAQVEKLTQDASDLFDNASVAKTREEKLKLYTQAAEKYSKVRKSGKGVGVTNPMKVALSNMDGPESAFTDALARLVNKNIDDASIVIDLRWPTQTSRTGWATISNNGEWRIRQIPNTKLFVGEVKEDGVWVTKPISLDKVREKVADPSNPKGYTKGATAYQRAVLNVLAQNDSTVFVATYNESRFYIPKEMVQNDAFLIELLGNARMDKTQYRQLRGSIGNN